MAQSPNNPGNDTAEGGDAEIATRDDDDEMTPAQHVLLQRSSSEIRRERRNSLVRASARDVLAGAAAGAFAKTAVAPVEREMITCAGVRRERGLDQLKTERYM